MPFEPCPACGYALSVLDHQCRHCRPSRSASAKAGAFALFDPKHLQKLIIAVVTLGAVVLYLILFR
jgi:hypothetical protein